VKYCTENTIIKSLVLGCLHFPAGVSWIFIIIIIIIIKQEAQLPQRNSAYLGWLTDRAMHRTPQNRRDALIQEVLAENAFCHETAAQGHSRSFILQSVTGRQGV